MNSMLSNRMFTYHLSESQNKIRHLNNGLLQGSVLTPILFYLYTCDLPTTTFRKFIDADNITQATQDNFEVTEEIPTNDLELI